MKKKLGRFLLIYFFICFCFISCSTTLKMNVTRPAKLDLKGAKSIGVLPFSQSSRFPFYSNGVPIGSDFDSYYKVSSVEQQVLNFIQNELEKGLMESPYINLVSSVAMKKALKGKGVNPADVYISGEMVAFNIFDEEKVVKKEVSGSNASSGKLEKDNSNDFSANSRSAGMVPEPSTKPEFIFEKFYTREILLVFNYQIVEGNSDNVLYFNTLKINHRSDPAERLDDLPDPYFMISDDLDNFVSSLLQLLQPYSLTRNITLLDDKTKNPQMEHADKLAKDGYLRECYNVFYDVYKNTGLFEAGYNGAMVLMVLGDLQGAENLMRNVYLDTGNIKASEGLADIMNEIRQKKILSQQIEQFNTEKDISEK